MEHTIMGLVILAIAICLILIAIVLPFKLTRLDISKTSRNAFAVMMLTLSAYLAWVSKLFFLQEVGPANYSLSFWFIRILCLISCIWFLIAAIRCDGRLYK